MSVIAPQHKRPLFFDLVEVLRRRLEVIVVKLYRFEPIIRAFPFLVEALLNHGLERFERGRLDIDIGETALRAVDRAFGPISGATLASSPTATMLLPVKAIACLIERAGSAV